MGPIRISRRCYCIKNSIYGPKCKGVASWFVGLTKPYKKYIALETTPKVIVSNSTLDWHG